MTIISKSLIFLMTFSISIATFADSFLDNMKFQKEIKTWPSHIQENIQEFCTTLNSVPLINSLAEETHELIARMKKSQTGKHLAQFVGSEETIICQYAGVGQRGFYDSDINLIAIDNKQSLGVKIVILAHEIRHLEQYKMDYQRTLKYSLEEYIRLVFAVEADAQAVSTLTTWEMKCGEDREPWDELMLLDHYKDTAIAFNETSLSNQMNCSNISLIGESVAAAYKGWLQNTWLTSNYAYQAKGMFYDELDESRRLQSYVDAPKEVYQELCFAGDIEYDCLAVLPSNDFIDKVPLL